MVLNINLHRIISQTQQKDIGTGVDRIDQIGDAILLQYVILRRGIDHPACGNMTKRECSIRQGRGPLHWNR